MKRTSLVILFAILVVGLAAFFIFRMFSAQTAPAPEGTTGASFTGSATTNLPSQGGGAPAPGGASAQPAGLTLTSAGGVAIPVNDFTKDPATVKDAVNPGHYLLGASPSGSALTSTTTAASYSIQYIDTDQSFTLELLQEPIASARQEAEQYLMSELGISESQMCQLKYVVSTPWWVNQFYAGKSLGFSFCDGAVKL